MSTTIAEPRILTLPKIDTGTEALPFIETGTEPGRCAHIILIPEEDKGRTTPQALVLEARIFGTPIEALCGYVWVPSQNPENFPVCEDCLWIYDARLKPDQRGKGLPEA